MLFRRKSYLATIVLPSCSEADLFPTLVLHIRIESQYVVLYRDIVYSVITNFEGRIVLIAF